MSSKQKLVEEIMRCGREPSYFINNYAQIQHPIRGRVPFRMYEYQNDVIDALLKHRMNIILKARQLGITTIVAAFIAWFLIFQQDKNVLILSTKSDTAKNTIRMIRNIIRFIPEDMMLCKLIGDNKQSIELNNGSRVKAVSTSSDAGRSEAVSLLFVDEVAFIEKMDELWTGIAPTISTGGRCVLSSTPNGVSNFFYREFKKAQTHSSHFNCRFGTYKNPIDESEMYSDRLMWWVHPEHDQSWFHNETKGKSEREIAQEMLCEFNSSGDTFLPATQIQKLQNSVEEPLFREFNDMNLWIFRMPVPNAVYLICCDVSSGFAEDYSAFHVLRVDSKIEQVAEYKGKIPADVLGDLLMVVSKKYNFATIAPENNSGWSGQTTQRITDAEYPYLYWSARKFGDYVDIYNSMQVAEALPGYRVTASNRMQMLAKMEQYIRNGDIIMRSERFVDEARSFIWLNQKPQAARSAHDDLIMALCGGIWIREESFMTSFAASENTEALISSMVRTSRPVSEQDGFNAFAENKTIQDKSKVLLPGGETYDFNQMLIYSG